MTIEHLRKMMNWSFVQCPQELVDTLFAQAADSNGIKQLNVAQVLFVTKHLQIRAFFSSAFVLWTRSVSMFDGIECLLILGDKYAIRLEIWSYADCKGNTTRSTARETSLITRRTTECAWRYGRDGRARAAT